jgi:iron-sulfur cluster repair protein YtfE (RIC family)
VNDIARGEQVEAELRRLIEKRSPKGETDQDEREELWKASVKRYHNGRQQELRTLWHAHETRMCEIHAALAEEHRVRAKALLESQG